MKKAFEDHGAKVWLNSCDSNSSSRS